MLTARETKKNKKDDGMEEVPLNTLVTATKGGELKVDQVIGVIKDNVIPASLAAEIVEELQGIKTLLQALGRGIENVKYK